MITQRNLARWRTYSNKNEELGGLMMMFTYNEGVTKSNPTQKCRPAKGISKRVNIQIIKDADITGKWLRTSPV
jgi:hypothetical protein